MCYNILANRIAKSGIYKSRVQEKEDIKFTVANLKGVTVMPKDNQCEIKPTQTLTYTVQEIAIMLQISIRKAYLFCEETQDFKVIRIGKSVRVHKESFDGWFGKTND